MNNDSDFSLSVTNLKFKYADKFRRSSFELYVESFEPGKNTALMGENGSGKTTLGKLIAGILRPVSGCVRYNGEDISSWKLGHIGKQVGYLFQEPSRQIFAPKPIEEIAMPLQLRGMPESEANEKAMALLKDFELENIINSMTYTLSRGEKQRLAIAAAMVMSPRYFVLDEPTTGLDKSRRKILADTLVKMREEGLGVLLISHDREFVDMLGANIRYMRGGRLLDEGKSL